MARLLASALAVALLSACDATISLQPQGPRDRRALEPLRDCAVVRVDDPKDDLDPVPCASLAEAFYADSFVPIRTTSR